MFLLSGKKFFVTSFIVVLSTAMLILVAINIREVNSIKLSLDSQNTFFWGILIIILQISLILTLYRSHKKIVYDLRRVSTIGELSHPKVGKILGDMGSIGQEIEHLLRTQNELIELRANRIAALNNLVSRLSTGFHDPILITDVRGKVLHMSSVLRDKIEKPVTNIKDIIFDMPLESAINLMQSNKSIWQSDDFKGLTINPIFGRDNLVTFCLWELESELKKINRAQEPHIKKIGAINNLIGKIKSRNKKDIKP